MIGSCGICKGKSLEAIWDLPALPLTEKYGIYDAKKTLHFDQKLLFCNQCGHVQLGMQISPHLLYTSSEYSFRTSQSNTARMGSQVFFDFFSKIKGERKFESLIDVGGNDLYLAKMMQLPKRCVIDPVCSELDGQTVDGIRIIGKLLEEVDLKKENLAADLIFCRHVLEHVAQPTEFLQQLFRQCHPDALYLFEIPCLENLVEANRFDAIFHQHYHYYDLDTFRRLIQEVGGEYIAHHYNRQGSCGGALLIAFRKGGSKPIQSPDLTKRKAKIQKAIRDYRLQMELMSFQLKQLQGPIYGYGASLMLATLGYHLKTDFSELVCILDDDPNKEGMGYQNLPVKIRSTKNLSLEPNSSFLITSLENTRVIYKRLLELSPRRILVPLIS